MHISVTGPLSLQLSYEPWIQDNGTEQLDMVKGLKICSHLQSDEWKKIGMKSKKEKEYIKRQKNVNWKGLQFYLPSLFYNGLATLSIS